MQITLSSKEFDEAVSLWLKAQGFTTDRYSISTRVIAGRSDGPLGTRLEVQLDPKPERVYTEEELAAMPFSKLGTFTKLPNDIGTPVKKYEYVPILDDGVGSTKPTKRFGQGHADE